MKEWQKQIEKKKLKLKRNYNISFIEYYPTASYGFRYRLTTVSDYRTYGRGKIVSRDVLQNESLHHWHYKVVLLVLSGMFRAYLNFALLLDKCNSC